MELDVNKFRVGAMERRISQCFLGIFFVFLHCSSFMEWSSVSPREKRDTLCRVVCAQIACRGQWPSTRILNKMRHSFA